MSIEHIHFEIFAANLDWLEVCLPMLFVGFWIVSQAVAIFRKIAGAGMEKPAGRINMPVPAKGERVFVDGQVDITRQIEDFLSQRIESAKTQSPPVLRSPASPRQEQNRSLVVKKTPRPSQRKGTAKPPALTCQECIRKVASLGFSSACQCNGLWHHRCRQARLGNIFSQTESFESLTRNTLPRFTTRKPGRFAFVECSWSTYCCNASQSGHNSQYRGPS